MSRMSDPGANALAVTPSDSTVLANVRGLYVGGTGDVAVTMLGGAAVTFATVPAGTVLPIRVSHVMAATTATNIVAIL